MGSQVVEDHVLLGNVAAVLNGREAFGQAVRLDDSLFQAQLSFDYANVTQSMNELLRLRTLETKATDVWPTARPQAANISRCSTGSGVGMDALGIPICQ